MSYLKGRDQPSGKVITILETFPVEILFMKNNTSQISHGNMKKWMVQMISHGDKKDGMAFPLSGIQDWGEDVDVLKKY